MYSLDLLTVMVHVMGLLLFDILFAIRIPREESTFLKTFGQKYMHETCDVC